MSDVVKLRTRAEIDEEAARWIWRMESGQASAAGERETLECWLREDPRHRRALDELSKVWSVLDVPAGAQHDARIAGLARVEGRSVRRIGGWRWLSAAAGLAVIVIGAALWLGSRNEIQTVSTAVGRHRNVTLADGSVVTLNTNTIVDIDLGRHRRTVHLRKGEAHFEIAHDRSRPFLVIAGDAVVRAVGTEFEVRLHADQHVDVLVNEGRVEVRDELPGLPVGSGDANSGPAMAANVHAVSAGERFSTGSSIHAVTPVSPAQVDSELAWREGAIVFDSEPLSEAIAEIERYTDTRIIVLNPEVGRLLVGGRFKTDDLQGFLDGLEAALPVGVRRGSDGFVYIDSRP